MSTVNIYALVSPISNDVFYVGATKKKLEHRITQHLTRNHLPTIKQLRLISKKPLFIILEKVHKDSAGLAEGNWINHFRNNGVALENTYCGGGYSYTKNTNPILQELRKNKINIVHSEYHPKEVEKPERTVLHLGRVIKESKYKAIELF